MTNLTATTREAWDKTVLREVWFKLILVNKLIERQQVLKAGTKVKHTGQFAEMDSLFQEYSPNDPLTGGKKTVLKTVEWSPKNSQVPVEISGDDWHKNQGSGDGKVIPLPQFLVKTGQRAMRLGINSWLYRAGASARDSAANAGFQGILDALTHDITYGGLTRSAATTNKWWQGASLGNVWTDQATQMTPTVANFRRCIDAVSHFGTAKKDLLAITSNERYRDFQAEVDGRRQYKEGPSARHGFTSMYIDEVEIVAEEFFSNPENDDSSTHQKYLLLLDLTTWRLNLDPRRGIGAMTPFVWQGQMAGALDQYLARIPLRGVLTCLYPNQNIFLSNVTF